MGTLPSDGLFCIPNLDHLGQIFSFPYSVYFNNSLIHSNDKQHEILRCYAWVQLLSTMCRVECTNVKSVIPLGCLETPGLLCFMTKVSWNISNHLKHYTNWGKKQPVLPKIGFQCFELLSIKLNSFDVKW